MIFQANSKPIAPTVTADYEHLEEGLDPNPHQISSIYARAAALDLTDRNPMVYLRGLLVSTLFYPARAKGVWGD
jgi:hypothetical protein